MLVVKKHFSCRCGSDVLRCCSPQTRVVHTPNNSTKPSVVDEQESEVAQSSFRSNVLQTASFLSERARCTQSSPSWNSTCFRFRLQASSKIRRSARVCKYKFAASDRIFRFLLHRGWICAVRGLRVPHKSTVCTRLLERYPLILSSSLCMLVTRDTICPALSW